MLDLEQAYANLRQRSLAIGIELPPYRRRPEDTLRAIERADLAVQERAAQAVQRLKRKRRKTTVDYYLQHDSHVRKYQDVKRSVRAYRRLQQAEAHAYDHHIEDLADDFYAGEIDGEYFPHLDPAMPHDGAFQFGSWRRALLARFHHLGY